MDMVGIYGSDKEKFHFLLGIWSQCHCCTWWTTRNTLFGSLLWGTLLFLFFNNVYYQAYFKIQMGEWY